jgi:hypothetical protein
MTDTLATPPAPVEPAAAPPAPAAAPEPAPARNLTDADVAALASALAASTPSTTGGAPAPAASPEPPTSPENLFTKGQVVTLTRTDYYDGETTRYGMVVDTLPDEGAGARSILAWFDDVSGPIGDHLLSAAD